MTSESVPLPCPGFRSRWVGQAFAPPAGPPPVPAPDAARRPAGGGWMIFMMIHHPVCGRGIMDHHHDLDQVRIGAKVVSHAKYLVFQLAEVAVPRQLFAAVLGRIGRLRLAEASG
jgi:hypothetical protein